MERRGDVILLNDQSEPADCFGSVLRHIFAVGVREAEVELLVPITFFCC